MPKFTGSWCRDYGFGWEPYEPFTVSADDADAAVQLLPGLKPAGQDFIGAYLYLRADQKESRIVSLPD